MRPWIKSEPTGPATDVFGRIDILQKTSLVLQHPGVVQAHVVPVPHRRMGEVGAAFIVVEEGLVPDPDAIIAHCRDRLARFKVPAHVFPIADVELPTSASGKIQKFLLTERATKLLEAGAP